MHKLLHKKVKRALFEAIDNVVWTGCEVVIFQWCKRNKVYDQITEEEIEEIRREEDPDEDEQIRLNGKYVWKTAKCVRFHQRTRGPHQDHLVW